MNATTDLRARLRDPADLVTALPYLLGFHPRDSLVVIAVHHGSPPTLGLVLRVDLPPPGVAPEFMAQLVEQLGAPLRARDPDAVLVVVIGGPPREPVIVAPLRAALDRVGIPVARAVWARSTEAGARWASLDRPGEGGTLTDPAEHQLAAVATLAGVVAFADRSELAALVAPDDDVALARRAALLDAAVRDAEHRRLAGVAAVAADLALVRAAVAAADTGRLPATDDEVVRLAVALSDPLVRDRSLGLCLGATAVGAERLWQALTRLTPAPEVAEPATLAALSAYRRGDGALAGIALERAQQAWPGHNLSTLLWQVLANAVPAAQVEDFLRDVAADATLTLADEGADEGTDGSGSGA